MLEFWNTCKRLSNPERVDMLRVVMSADAERGITVGGVADIVRYNDSAVSQYLAQLEDECGLVHQYRDGRYVYYRPWTDGPESAMVAALRKYFLSEDSHEVWYNGRRPRAPEFVSALPALANETRLRIVRYLRGNREATMNELMHALGLTDNNARRHVRIIAQSGFCRVAAGVVVWKEPRDRLTAKFLERALRDDF